MIETRYYAIWVCDNYHRLAGVSAVEGALIDRAIELFLGAEVRHQDFPAIVAHMRKLQEDIILSHPRCNKCEISMTENPIVEDSAALQIGSSRLDFMRVKKAITFQTE